MKAVIFPEAGPIDAPNAFADAELDAPVARGRDLLVRVNAVSVNPVDYKVRNGSVNLNTSNVLGWDASGVIEAVGEDATLFKPGDNVFYAGSIDRQGSNAELQLVDERIVGPKPESLSHAEAAALPLTALTAWEMLFDRLGIEQGGGEGSILIVAAAGGVGSIATQLARRLTDLTVIGTASRAETKAFAKALGAHHVIDHSRAISEEVKALGLGAPRYVFVANGAEEQFAEVAETVAPQGKIGFIVAPKNFDHGQLFVKSVAACWEFMYTRPLFQTADMARQHAILKEVSRLVDAGEIKTTMTEVLGRISAETLTKAHKILESGKARGKIVLEGF